MIYPEVHHYLLKRQKTFTEGKQHKISQQVLELGHPCKNDLFLFAMFTHTHTDIPNYTQSFVRLLNRDFYLQRVHGIRKRYKIFQILSNTAKKNFEYLNED